MSEIVNHLKETKRKLPDGWRWVKLGEVCELNPRRPSIDRKDSDVTSFIPMEAVDAISGMVSNVHVRTYKEVKKGYTFFSEGDVLFAKITPCMQNGKHTITKGLIGDIGFGTTEFHVLRPKENIISEFIWFFIRQPSVLVEATEHFTGAVGQQRVPESYLASIEIPLPPLSEQRRIAELLHEKMAAVEKARVASQARLGAVKAMPAAFLRQVFPQPGQTLPDGWRAVKLGEVVTVISGQHILESDYNRNGHGIGYLTGPADFGVTKPAITKWTEKPRVLCEPMDVLVTVKGAGVGNINLSPDVPVAIGRQLMAMRAHYGSIDTMFLFSFLITRFDYFQENAMGATVPGLSRKDLEMLVIPLPPVTEQRWIAGLLGEQMAAVEKARVAAEEELAAINTLPAALLRRAFNGEI